LSVEAVVAFVIFTAAVLVLIAFYRRLKKHNFKRL
jgi:hypothetical protein